MPETARVTKPRHAVYRWTGLGGVPPHDRPAAYAWERRLHWPMVLAALLALPAFYFEAVLGGDYRDLGRALSLLILTAFSIELLIMLAVTRQRLRYLLWNWLSLFIVVASAGYIFGWYTGEIPYLVPALRLIVVVLFIARIFGALRTIFSPTGVVILLGLGGALLGVAGVGFYWLEPTVHSYAEGLWLAFTTGATVGYGDMVPTTPAARIFAVLIVLLGYALLSMLSASVVALVVGEDEQALRREMHRDIQHLRRELAALRADMAARGLLDGAGAHQDQSDDGKGEPELPGNPIR
ncbi:ion channel [Thermithiobacillus tepidarius DSM 3134]|uniref:potassium channel family protein n=1 Tax=Thermithiobacillus tepidarius TaxID=929 RepID=UPI0003F524C9|nr:potassium channel family protein [Thermithiobacillus tepidarius]